MTLTFGMLIHVDLIWDKFEHENHNPTHNRFTALWILSGTTRVSQHQKGKTRKVKPIWIYWSKR